MSMLIGSINTTVGTYAQGEITRNQIGFWTLAMIGARDFVKDDATGLLQFQVSGGRLRKIRIRLTPADLYAVEIGHMDFTTLDWIVDGFVIDVFAEDLSQVVADLYTVGIDHTYEEGDDDDWL